jgi:hypothetical protein
MSIKNHRRAFLGRVYALGIGALLASFAPKFIHASGASGTENDDNASNSEASLAFAVKIVSNLFDAPISIQLAPDAFSAPIRLSNGSTYRVKITPLNKETRFGHVYSLVLADASGQQLDNMNIGSNTTATFRRFGVQVYVLAIQQAGASATALQ